MPGCSLAEIQPDAVLTCPLCNRAYFSNHADLRQHQHVDHGVTWFEAYTDASLSKSHGAATVALAGVLVRDGAVVDEFSTAASVTMRVEQAEQEALLQAFVRWGRHAPVAFHSDSRAVARAIPVEGTSVALSALAQATYEGTAAIVWVSRKNEYLSKAHRLANEARRALEKFLT